MKLNKEVERDAFETALIAGKIANDINITSKWDGEKYVSKFSDSKPYTQAMFECWLAAKAHAIEEAKPKATVFKDGDYWWFICNRVSRGIFESSAQAIAAAESAGLKVIAVTGFDHGKAK